jgi:hypothetical protein
MLLQGSIQVWLVEICTLQWLALAVHCVCFYSCLWCALCHRKHYDAAAGQHTGAAGLLAVGL